MYKLLILFFVFSQQVIETHSQEFAVSNNTTQQMWLKVDFLWRSVPSGYSTHFARPGSSAEFYVDQAGSPMTIQDIQQSDASTEYEFEITSIPSFTLDYDGTNSFVTVWKYSHPYTVFTWSYFAFIGVFVASLVLHWFNQVGKPTPEID